MYGKNSVSNNKLRVLDGFSKGKDFSAISRELRVQRATAEVYTIDAFAAGKEIDHEHLAQLLGVPEDLFSQLQQLLFAKDRLIEVKEASSRMLIQSNLFHSGLYGSCVIRDVDM